MKCLRTIKAHSEPICSMAITPDEQFLASSSRDKTIKLWSLSSGDLIHTWNLPSKYSQADCLAISPDGMTLAAGESSSVSRKGEIQKIFLFNIKNKKLVSALSGHSYSVQCVTFSCDSKLIVSGSLDDTIKIWKAESNFFSQFSERLIRTLSGHSSTVRSLAISPNGQIIASGSDDKSIKIWNLHTGELIYTLPTSSVFLNSIAFSPDGEKLVSSSGNNSSFDYEDGVTEVWSLKTKKVIQTFPTRSNMVAISCDGQTLAVGKGAVDKGKIQLWNLNKKHFLDEVSGHYAVTGLIFSRDGSTLISSGGEGEIRIWRYK
jgi:sugar lactone lactonase YvrE